MNDVANEERLVLGTRALRKRRMRRLVLAMAVFVALPTLVAVILYGFVVRAQYESVAVFTVESGVEADSAANKVAEERDLEVARAHIHSRATLEQLVDKHGFREHFTGEGDWWSRLAADAGSEATFNYFRGQVLVKPESKHTLAVHVFAFSPERARELAMAIVELTSEHLRMQADKTRADMLDGPRGEVEAARGALLAAAKTKGDGGDVDLELEVARARLASALRGFETAETEAARHSRRMVVIAEPSLPTEASRPRRAWNIATVLVTALALGGMVLLLGDFVREHAKF